MRVPSWLSWVLSRGPSFIQEPYRIRRRESRLTVHSMYGPSNIQKRSYNHFCSGKAISITYSECVSVALVIQHVKRTFPVAICGLSGFTTFSHTFRTNGTIFGGKKSYWTWKGCFDLSTAFIWNMSVLRKIKWDILCLLHRESSW